jgi:MFS family permease
MMFLQYLMRPVWLVPLLPYVQSLEGGGRWVFACGLLMGIGTLTSPFVGMFADRFFNAEKVLAACNAAVAALLGSAFFVSSPAALFWVLLPAMLVYMPTWSISSAIAMEHSSESDFPRLRVFGSLGWVASGFFSIIGTSFFSIADFDSTRWIFASGSAAAAVAALMSLTLPSTAPRAKGTPMNAVDALGLKAFVLFRDPVFAAFGVLITLAMIPFSWYVAYNAVYLAESGFRHLTFTQNLGQAAEVGFMLLVPVLVGRLGYRWAMVLGILAVSFRYVCFLGAVELGFAAGDFGGILVHGLAFGILCIGSQMYVAECAPGELKNQAQGLIMLLTTGIGVFFSNFVFHRILESAVISADPVRHDWSKPYWIALAMTAVLAVAVAVLFRPGKNKKRTA